MFAQIIELKNTNSGEENDPDEPIANFLCSLYNNGQILSEYITIKNDLDFELYVTAPKLDSLDPCHDNVYVKRDRAVLGERFEIVVSQVGVNANSREYCSCKKRTAIEMQTFAQDIDSVFTCCSCGKPIALYELPYLDNQEDHWYIVNWQSAYRATDTLWLSGFNDRFTGNQLVNVNSALNKIGREIADKIAKTAGLKCYYNIFDDLTRKVEFTEIDGKPIRVCPSCGNPMKYIKFSEDYERFICDNCMLSSELPKDDPLK